MSNRRPLLRVALVLASLSLSASVALAAPKAGSTPSSGAEAAIAQVNANDLVLRVLRNNDNADPVAEPIVITSTHTFDWPAAAAGAVGMTGVALSLSGLLILTRRRSRQSAALAA